MNKQALSKVLKSVSDIILLNLILIFEPNRLLDVLPIPKLQALPLQTKSHGNPNLIFHLHLILTFQRICPNFLKLRGFVLNICLYPFYNCSKCCSMNRLQIE